MMYPGMLSPGGLEMREKPGLTSLFIVVVVSLYYADVPVALVSYLSLLSLLIL